MAPPTRDLFKPPPGRRYSKEAVNRAGEVLRVAFRVPRESGVMFGGHDVADVVAAMETVTWWKQEHARPLTTVAANLRYHVAKEDGEFDGRIDVAQRLKKRDTIIDKLNRYPTMRLTRMHDIGGVRATLPSLTCLQAVSRRLRKTWTIAATRDYVAEPKESGYRAIHHDVARGGKVIEVQLRAFRQHAWANQVEDDGRTLGTGYKFGFGDEDVHSYYRLVSETFWYVDSDQPLREGLEDELRAAYDKIKAVLRPQPPQRR